MSPFLTHVQNYYYTGISQKKTSPVEYFFSFGLAEILSDTVHQLFPQHQCCKHTVWEITDQCCPYGNSTPGHSALKMSLFQSSLPLWLLVYLRKFLWNTQFLTFCLSIYCLDFKWFAMTGKTCFGSATLKSAQNFRPEKKLLKVSGELWEMCGLMVIALVSECQAVWVQALAGDIVLCSGTQHLSLST